MVIECKELANKIKQDVKNKVQNLKYKPHFLVIHVDYDPASKIYVRNKKRVCEEIGIEFKELDFNSDVTTEVLVNNIKLYQFWYDAVMVQLPLPPHINEHEVINAIDPNKDVDGLTDINVGRLWNGEDGLFPCTALGIIEILKTLYDDLSGLKACVVGRSKLVGKPVTALLLRENCTPCICHSKTDALWTKTLDADVIISAVGKPKFIDYFMLHRGQNVIDVGINRNEEGKLCGDCDTYKFDERNIGYTPVPGGVGLMTVAMLMSNILKAYELNHKGE